MKKTDRSTRRRERSQPARLAPWTALAALLTLAAASAAQAPQKAPAAPAQPRVEVASAKLFEKSARAAMAALDFYGVPETDDSFDAQAQEQRILNIGYQLAAHARFERYPFSFYLIDMPVPNAFALPGGHIFVTRGMLELGLDDDMLACLLAHEIAHVVFEHGTRMQRRSTLLNILSQAALIGVLVGADDGPENTRDPYGVEGSRSRRGSLVQGTAAAGIVFSQLLLRKYSRGFEDEADAEGQRLAAAAGFDPDGARALWQLMTERLPTSNEYGYWRTHPFSDQRLRAAEIRARDLKIQEPGPVFVYRRATQEALLRFAAGLDEDDALNDGEREPPNPKGSADAGEITALEPWREGLRPFLQHTALHAWPSGDEADTVRLAFLHRLKERVEAQPELSRDYGRLIARYDQQIALVREVSPRSSLLAELVRERGVLESTLEGLYPKAVAVWRSEVYQTPFLETFLSNYPRSALVPGIALALGNAYSRSRREAAAVEQYLLAMKADPAAEPGQLALQGLRNLAPHLDELAALQMLSEDIGDGDLERLAQERLRDQVGSFETLRNGSTYLTRYPQSGYREQVHERLEKLAQNLYGEIVLYQNLGDHVKALERIQQVLEHAPMTPAAEALREKAILDG
ncbi:MAG: M48 family metalloprotease [Acidobacteriota bacterium]